MTTKYTWRRNIIFFAVLIYIYIYVCMYVYVCVYIYIYIYIYVCVCIYILIYMCVYVCVYIYIYIYIYNEYITSGQSHQMRCLVMEVKIFQCTQNSNLIRECLQNFVIKSILYCLLYVILM